MVWFAPILFLIHLTQSKYVTQVLNANWAPSPLVIETSEFLAEEDNALFFTYLKNHGGRTFDHEQDAHEEIVHVAQNMLPKVSVALLKLSLSLRQYSPRAEMFNQVAKSVKGDLSCEAFVQINSQVSCLTPDLSTLITTSSTTNRVKLIKHDHVYRDNHNLPQVILYCDFQTKPCHQAALTLMEMADSNTISFIFRHHYIPGTGRVQLSGYGVELAVKSTEYTAVDDSKIEGEEGGEVRDEDEIEGFRFEVLKERFPEKVEELEKFKEYLIDAKDAMKPLKAWEISDLGYQASQKVVNAMKEESLTILSKYSQNLPSLARSLSKTKVSQELRNEIKKNQEILERYGVKPGNSVLLLNGMMTDLESADPFTLLKKLRGEAQTVGGLQNLDLKADEINTLLKSDLFKQSVKYGIDMRNDAVLYLNDLEQDPQYTHWPGHLHELLRPSYPGMLKHLRKNIHNVAFLLRPGEAGSGELLKLVAVLLENHAPVRIGVVFTSEGTGAVDSVDSVDSVVGAMVNYILTNKGREDVGEFLTDISEEGFTLSNVMSEFSDNFGVKITPEFIGENSALVETGNKFIQSTGLRSPCMVINGVVITDLSNVQDTLLDTIQSQLPKLQRAVYLGDISDGDNILDWYMSDSSILPRYNPDIMSSTPYTLALADMDHTTQPYQDLDRFLNLSPWVGDSGASAVSVVLSGDYGGGAGQQLLLAVLQAADMLKETRFALLFPVDSDTNFKIWSVYQTGGSSEEMLAGLRGVLDGGPGYPGDRGEFGDVVRSHRGISHVALHIKDGEVGVMYNGRVVAPFTHPLLEDIVLIETLEIKSGAGKLKEIMSSYESDDLMRAASLLRRQDLTKRISFPDLGVEHSSVVVPGEGPFQVEAVLDPLSVGAQQISQILKVLHKAGLISLRIVLNPIDKLSEIPVKRFYRYVLEPELKFTESGQVADVGSRFTNLLPHLLLTMSLSTPVNWMVASTRSPYDLDNIKLNDVEKGVSAEYTLEYLVIEGHSHDPLRYNNPTKGLQYDLVSGGVTHDTIVMANLGYFQLKAGPGLWTLSLREGPSKEIYQITGVEGPGTQEEGLVTVTVGDLTSTFITVDATKKQGMTGRSISEENEEREEGREEEGGLWSSLKSIVNGEEKAKGSSNTNETINVFSVASGHLYERMLGVMMQSVLANTKNPVKFWFLKNYLSPKFINTIPTIAEELGCEIEFVQYQWPSWLQSQTEKQRIIWGYKILFLDVLFPMSLKKIIFVDADQIVRADLRELLELDLRGAPYGYTPFCDDKPEMDGFRFWKQGYWRNHLMGRAYHISALYVVDLVKFRLISAGDRLRGQYQGLSQDPNSLSNLDQDLPNNMIHHVPIHSLPQEWLWCETWCSDASKKQAKTIDLCNNPLTKEPKLDRAMRIAPEWRMYDMKLKKIIEKAENSGSKDSEKSNNKKSESLSHVEL